MNPYLVHKNPVDSARPHSAPATLERWEEHDFAWSDAASYDYTTSSETDEECQPDEINSEQANPQHGHELWSDVSLEDVTHCFIACSHEVCKALIERRLYDKVVKNHKCAECKSKLPLKLSRHAITVPTTTDHVRLAQYARDLRGMMKEAMDRFVACQGTEPFPTYTEKDYVEGVDRESPRNGHVASAVHEDDKSNVHTSSDHQKLNGDGSSSFETGASSIDQHASFSTLSSSTNQHESEGPDRICHKNRRIHRKEACYFGVSEDLDTEGRPLVTRRARVRRDI
ncbi:hypothetical protein BU25DRAFT_414661 [Macroventuria anomochaeta]|uniref:Uncharacterized protein n=1 Tax=Macroventuria anomochaeta TaxID=301207 RepID=A0ACB6RQG9_9PLEO|nr:uncharacterized protein BU25DRAFT_414661 [Macroventuria anomochaeta]KAF2623154.1 hypothetical protein BU25DRAFT_414661 [Macroventuria anomochaeta]